MAKRGSPLFFCNRNIRCSTYCICLTWLPRKKLNDWFNGSKLSLVFQVLDKYSGIEIFEQPELVGWWKYVKTCLNDLLLYKILTTRKEGLWWVNSTHLTFSYYVIKRQKIPSHSILKGENLLEKSFAVALQKPQFIWLKFFV